jgi:sterol desaturase/sphingolipid hydroxylase (fatty acid hydroxylase superfamily)
METNLTSTIEFTHLCLLLGGSLLVIGLENRYPLAVLQNLKARLGHAGANLALWLVTLVAVDHWLSRFMYQDPLMQQLAEHGLLSSIALSPVVVFLVAFLALDLSAYVMHYLMHRVPWFWSFHAVHHSDHDLDVSSSFRFHPLEILFGLCWQIVIVVLVGIPIWVVALRALILLPLTLLHHANVDISPGIEKMLRSVLVSPGLHKIHHSPRQAETDSNYGLFLSLWDRMFGTLRQESSPEGPRYGLGYLDDAKWQSVWGMLRTPWSGQFKLAPA